MFEIIRMAQDITYHLAYPGDVRTDWGGTVSLCGQKFGSPVEVTPTKDRDSIRALPTYRGRNEPHRCPRCDTTGQQRLAEAMRQTFKPVSD